MKRDLKQIYPNNKPFLTTIEDLQKIGKAVTCRSAPDDFGIIEIWTIDIFGRIQRYFLEQ